MQEQPTQDMTLTDFRALIRLAKADRITPRLKLLGGEPTAHPEFPRVLTILRQEGASACLISNLLFESEMIRNSLRQAIKDKVIDGCLSNAAELDTEAKMNCYVCNYQDMQTAFDLCGSYGFVAAGITLSRHKSAEEEMVYIERLVKAVEIRRLRISLDFQAENQFDGFFIGNKKYGDKIKAVIYKCLDLRIPVSWDCKIYPCLFSKEVFQKDIQGFIPQIRSLCPVDDAPFDIFPDMSYSHCYPARMLSGKNILKFKRLSESMGEIAFLKNALRAIQKKSLPEDCRGCSYYRTGQCDSLCLGCQELNAGFLQNG
jgi:organic radical activating enzyme